MSSLLGTVTRGVRALTGEEVGEVRLMVVGEENG